MKQHQFQVQIPNITDNVKLRKPQRDGFLAIQSHFSTPDAEREVSVILPVGCGKSGLITLTPFAVKAKRALVIAPSLNIADQLLKDFDPASAHFFYEKCSVLAGPHFQRLPKSGWQ